MKTGWIAIATFAAGVGVGLLIKPGTPDAPATSATLSGTQPTKTSNERPTDSAERQRIDGLLSHMTQRARPVFFDGNQDTTLEPAIEAADYPKLLEALQQRAGLSGLSSEDQNLFGKLLGDWYAADPQRAASWVRTVKNPDDRRELGEVLVATAAKSDYDEAIRLMQEFSIKDDGGLQVPDVLIKAAATRGAEELLKLCSMSVGEDDGAGGSAPSYPVDFDFRTALEGFNGLKAKGVKLASYPLNLLEEWTKRDPETALQWYAGQGPDKARGASLSVYFTNFMQSATADELASKIAMALSVAGPKEHIVQDISSGLNNSVFPVNPLVLSQMLSKLPEGLDQTGLRVALMDSSSGSGGGKEGSALRESLLGDLEPGERVSLLQTVFADKENTRWEPESLDSLKQSLVKLGHSEQQIAELLPKTGTSVKTISFGTIGSGFLQEDEEPAAEGTDSSR
jgi:hypothetical protein